MKPWATIKTRRWTYVAYTLTGLKDLFRCANAQGGKMDIVWHRPAPEELANKKD